MLFSEVPFLERFRLAKDAGFRAVEYLFPYDWPADQLSELLEQNELKQVLFNLPPGNWEQGDRGIACHPQRISEFREGVDHAIEYAKNLKVERVNCLAGLKPEDISEEIAQETLLNNIAFACSRLEHAGIQMLIEPINSRIDMPGFFVDTIDKAANLISNFDNEQLGLQFDIYHMQIMHGDLTRLIDTHFDKIRHIQFADNPGRHQPGTGEINFSHLFRHLDDIGYDGWVSAEYRPDGPTCDTFDWLS